MDGSRQHYLKLTALPAVGETVLDARPAFVISADGTTVLYANAAGAGVFGARTISGALGNHISALNPLRAQVARLARQLPSDHARLEILRIGQGVALTTLPAACRRLNLADGTRAVLAIGAGGATAEPLTTRTARLIDGLADRDGAAAVLAADGSALAKSTGYDAAIADEADLGELIAAAVESGEPLTERRVGRRACGVARFSAEGRALLLAIIGADDKGAAMPAPIVEAPDEPAIPEDASPPEPEATEAAPPDEPPRPLIQFVYGMDADRRVTFASPELAATVGEATGAIAGHLWTDIADAFGFEPDAAAGGTVRWPTANGDTVAVTLAVTPGRTGFHGFGTIDPADRAADTRVDRRALDAPATPQAAGTPPETTPTSTPDADEPPALSESDMDIAARHSIEEGRHIERAASEPPALLPTPPAPTNVVRLPGAPAGEEPAEALSPPERDAFKRIAEALGARQADDAAPPPEAPSSDAKPPARRARPSAPGGEFDSRLLDRLPVGIAIFREGKTLLANRTLLEFLFYDSFATFLGAGGVDSIFPGNGVADSIAGTGGRLAALRRDGVRVPVRAWLHAVTFAGATALMLSLIPSIERNGEAEDELTEQLVQSEARTEELEAILDTATDGVLVLDQRGHILSMNRAAEALFGVGGKDYAGRYFTDLIADESQKAALDYLDGLASNGVASVLNDGREVIGRVPAGGLIPLFMTMGRLGEADKFCAVLRDITHWKNVEAELIAARRDAETANTQKSEFLAKVSHEIRTPLNAIIGFSEVMMSERFGPISNERYRDYLRDINISGAHLVSLINDLLDLSKIEAGKYELTFSSVAINAAIQECVAIMQPQANRERIIIRTSLPPDVPSVVADPRSMRQILLNLVSNAIKFTRAGGQVIVSSALETNGEVTVRIRDTGIGMSEKDIEVALKPFRQVAAAREDRDQGTGLGLPLTKAMIEANRATLTIDSTPDQGTLIKITFPTTRVLAG